jgi:hypothetical protein
VFHSKNISRIKLIIPTCDIWNVTWQTWKPSIHRQNYWVFGLLPSSGILENRKQDVSEIGYFRPQVNGGEDTYSVGPLRKNFSPFAWGRKQIQFPKRRVFYSLEYRTTEKVQNPSNSVCSTPSSVPFRVYFDPQVQICSNYYAPHHQNVRVSGRIDPSFLTSALYGGEWPASRPGHFTPEEKAPWFPLAWRFVKLQRWSGRYRIQENTLPLSEFEPRPSSPKLIISTKLSQLLRILIN